MTLFSDTSLFTSGAPRKEIYEPEDASLILIESFFDKEESDSMYESLLKKTGLANFANSYLRKIA